MSKLRSINTHFWEDNYVIDLDPIEKLLFLYLLSNPQTNMLGIYELHIRRIAFDTGIDKDMLKKIFDRFTEANKIKYIDGYVVLQNFLKHQKLNPNMETSAIQSWNELPLDVREDTFCKPIAKALKGLTKASEPIAEIERELEKEIENEDESITVTSIEDDVPNASDSETWLSSIRIAEHLLDAICQYDSTHKYNHNKPSLNGWVKEIDRALRLDGRTEEQMTYLIDYIFKANGKNSAFWAGNILSGAKLREKFDTIKNQIKNEKTNGRTQGGYEARKQNTDKWLDEYYSQSEQ